MRPTNEPSRATDTAAVRLDRARKSYGTVRAVDGVDLVIEPGEVVALLGPNGAGKSTTVDLILGLSKPDGGQVRVFGRTPSRAVADGLVGAMLQDGQPLEDATVAEVGRLVHALHRAPMPVEQALRRAGIAELADRRCTKLSGGQQQRLRFAVALVADPDLLVLDEPTAAMDVGTRRGFWASMREFTDTGRTVLFATHYLAEAEEFADRVVLLRAGAVVADGSVAEVRAYASGRILRARIPDADETVLAELDGVSTARVRGEQVELTCADSDTALRRLLARHPQAADIEIRAVGLEEAFLALTGAPDGPDHADPNHDDPEHGDRPGEHEPEGARA